MISVIHPAARPARLAEVVRWWFDRAAGDFHGDYHAGLHVDQQSAFISWLPKYRQDLGDDAPISFHVNYGKDHPTSNGRSSFVGNVNKAAEYAKTDILVLATDDLEPPEHWDRLIREAIPDPSKEVILRCSNGNAQSDARRLILHPVMTRARYERQGWFFCPEYTGVFSDNDLTERAYIDGVVVEAPHIVFRHHHPIFDPSVPVDDIYRAGNSPEEYARGSEVFQRRKAQGFPLGAAVTV